MNEMSNSKQYKRNDKNGDDSRSPKAAMFPDSAADFVFATGADK
jgi:hypothetical protein